MPSYEVIKPCYVPFGNGKLRYRPVGTVVTLDVDAAEKLDGFVRPVNSEDVVRKPDITEGTPEIVRIPDTTEDTAEPVRFPDTPWATRDSEVADVGDPTPGHE